jgi:hypothetical protein
MVWVLQGVGAIVADAAADAGASLGLSALDAGLARLFLLLLLGLLGIGFCWAMVLAAARWMIGHARGEEGFGLREPTVGWGAPQRSALRGEAETREPPSIGDAEPRGGLSPAPAAAAGGPRMNTHEPASRLKTHASLPVRHVRLAKIPHPQPLGSVKSARPEWTGAVVPTSLAEAGAVEVTRVSVQHELSAKERDTVRAVDYCVSALPRVDAAGRRRPNMLVYAAFDRGLMPKAAKASLRRKA